jgi:hypothetical protein
VSTSSRISWTNKSVLKFAGESDPISLIEQKSRQLVLRARDAGWSGPPYNPIAIADLLKIPVEASSDVIDARTVATDTAVKIEFNPARARGGKQVGLGFPHLRRRPESRRLFVRRRAQAPGEVSKPRRSFAL